MSWLTKADLQHWQAGRYDRCYEKLGAHPNRQGTWFAVWAPNADAVSVIGDFNGWAVGANPLQRREEGLWEVYVRGAQPGARYKYHIQRGRYQVDKTDPFAFQMEPPVEGGHTVQGLSAVISDLSYAWGDDDWMQHRRGPSGMHDPVSVYEVHLGSWQRDPDGGQLGYRALAKPLADYVEEMGFTHIEMLPVMEHPYYASWGYQVVGYFAPTQRYGTPQDLMYFIDYMHQRGIGVLLDWVPAHFASDPQGLSFFDGTTLFEYDDPLMRTHPDWGTFVFDYNKPGVRNFLIANACFWLDHYHIDGLRFDAVASMLYRDYSRDHWRPNRYGGRENLEAISFLKQTNEVVYSRFPEAMMVAEESTAWPKVSFPTFDGGLGFLYKWNMGWMHDTLRYMQQDALFRQYGHNDLTFPLVYAYSEHYALPLSHDEVVHGKGSLWGKMPGDAWQKAANLRLLFGHMYGHPGKKLLFMGGEFGQEREWNHDAGLDWDLLDQPLHKGLQDWVKAINALYREAPVLANERNGGFAWIDFSDHQQSVVSYQRTMEGEKPLVFVFNFTPVPRPDYPVGLPQAGGWRERLNSDDPAFGGSGIRNPDPIEAQGPSLHGLPASAHLSLPPLGVVMLEPLSAAPPAAPSADDAADG